MRLLQLLAFNLGIVELDVSLETRDGRLVVGGSLLDLLLLLGIFLLIWRADDAPAASPWNTSAKSDTNPFLRSETRALHNNVDVVERFALARNQSASIGFLESRLLVHGEANASSPLYQGVVGVEVQEVSVLSGSGNAENILEGLLIL